MAFFPNQNRDPFPRNLMVPGRVRPVGAQANGYGTAQFGAQGGNPALKNGYAPTLPGQPVPPKSNPGGRPNPFPVGIPGGSPGPVKNGGGGGGGQPQGGGQYWGANPNQIMDMLAQLGQGGTNGNPGPQGGPAGGAQRNPLGHLRWWLQNGWRYNDQTGRFKLVPGSDYTGPQLGGRPNPTQGQPNPGQHPGPQGGPDYQPSGNGQNGGGQSPAPQGGPTNGGGQGGGGGMFDPTSGALNPGAVQNLRKQFGLPLDSQFEAERRAMVQALNSQLAQIMAARGNVEGQYGLDTARMATQQGLDDRALVDQMAARGIIGSGVQNRAQGLQDAQYARQGQDLGFAKAGQLGDLAGQQSALQSQFTSGLMEAIMDLIRRQSATGGRAPKGK